MSTNQQPPPPQTVTQILAPELDELARQVRQRATLALAALVTTTLQIHDERMDDWVLEQPEFVCTFNPLTNESYVSYTIQRVLPGGVLKRRQFIALFEGTVLVNSSVEFCTTEVLVQPTAVVS